MEWTRVEIAGKPADAFAPVASPRFAVLFLHPADGPTLTTNPAYTAAFAKHGLAVCAPHGARSWWVDRVCPEFDPRLTAERQLLDNVLPWVRQRWNLGPRAVAVAGIGMGGQGAVRLGFRYPERFPVAASVAGAFDFHELYGHGTPLDEMYRSREACRQDSAILWVNPAKVPPHVWFVCDPADAACYRGNDRLHEKLAAVGVEHVADLETSTGENAKGYADAMAEPMAKWIVDSLILEGRRLI